MGVCDDKQKQPIALLDRAYGKPLGSSQHPAMPPRFRKAVDTTMSLLPFAARAKLSVVK